MATLKYRSKPMLGFKAAALGWRWQPPPSGWRSTPVRRWLPGPPPAATRPVPEMILGMVRRNRRPDIVHAQTIRRGAIDHILPDKDSSHR